MPRCISARSVAAALSVMAILAVTSFFTGQANAQVSGATLSGTATDPSGAVIAGAKVSILNKGTGASRDVTTDAAGLYTAPNLLPGDYEVTIAATGFQTTKEQNVTLTVGGQQTLNVALKVGEAAQTVLVTEAAPLVQLGSSTISTDIDSKQILEMPLNGRSWQDLATLVPGVNGIETQIDFANGAIRGNRGFGNQLTISGGRPNQNNYRLDGNSITDYAMGGPGSVLGVNLGVDAIEEFSVISGNYSAEYGRTSGGIVNALSKSGTNAFHGDIYWFLRNQDLDANDFFSNVAGQPKTVYKRNQFGAAGGGPIKKDRTFIFFDYEGIRQVEGLPSSSSVVLSDAARAGNLCSNAACTSITHVNVDPVIQKYLALYPHANGPVNGDKGQFVFSPPATVHENYYTGRVDHKIGDKDNLFGTYNYDDTPFTTEDGFGFLNIVDHTTRYISALEETHIFSPTLLNSARLGYNGIRVINYSPVSAINPAEADQSLSMMPGFGPAQIVLGGGFGKTTAGLPPGFTHHNWDSIQFYDDAFWTRGAHSLKFGLAVERMRYDPFSLYLPTGLLRFNGKKTSAEGLVVADNNLADLLTNQPASLEGGLPPGVSPRGFRQTLFGGYIQDDWKFRKNLTLNLGLRYEMTTVIDEVNGKTTSLYSITDPLPHCGTSAPTATNIVYGKAGCADVGPIFTSNPTRFNFEPRIGFAWDPKGDGKMAVRGGFAIFDVLPLPGYFFANSWMPFFLTGTVANNAATPWKLGTPPNQAGSAFSYFGPVNQPGCNSPLGNCTLTASYAEPNPSRNYVEQWNINIQRQITSTLTASVGYVGSHGLHLLMRGDDFNMVIPTQVAPGQWLWPGNSTPKDKINPDFGTIRGIIWNTSSRYNAAVFNVQKRLSRGFQFGGNYTYSKSMDSDSSGVLGDQFSNSITTWFWFAPSISWGPSDFNFTHTATINGIWQVPVPASFNGPTRAALGGWQLSGIFKTNSGVPTTPLIAGDPMNVQNNGSDTFGIPDKVPGCNPVNSNFKSNPGGVFLGYVNTACYHVPMASEVPAAFQSRCVPFSAVPGSCSNLLGNAGRNSIVGPNLYTTDLSVIRNFAVRKISESANVQFRAEFFNILNHANFTPPLPFFGASNAQLFNANGTPSGGGGLQQPLVTRPRTIQFALKIMF